MRPPGAGVEIDFCWYKIGLHDRVKIWRESECDWFPSSRSADEIEKAIEKSAKEEKSKAIQQRRKYKPRTTNADKILKLLHEGPAVQRRITEITGLSVGSVEYSLSALVKKGDITQSRGEGKRVWTYALKTKDVELESRSESLNIMFMPKWDCIV